MAIRTMLQQFEPQRTRSERLPARSGIAVTVLNHAHLERAYGLAVADAVMRELQWQVHQAGGSVAMADGSRLIFYPPTLLAPSAVDYALPMVESWQLKLSGQPIYCGDHVVLPVVSVRSVRFEHTGSVVEDVLASDSSGAECDSEEAVLPWVGLSLGWRKRYRLDMATAVAFHGLLRSGKGRVVFDPVHAVSASDAAPLYHVARLKLDGFVGTDPLSDQSRVFVDTLERLGVGRSLDRAMVMAALDALETGRDHRIACPLSIHSLAADAWWYTIIDRLAENPDLAARLTFEVRFTTPLSDVHGAIVVAQRLKALGCCFAVDATGGDDSRLAFIRAVHPVAIKVSASLVQAARDAPDAFEYLWRLTELSRLLVSEVVFEGVDSVTEVAIARHAGAGWMQGAAVRHVQHVAPVPMATFDQSSAVVASPRGARRRPRRDEGD